MHPKVHDGCSLLEISMNSEQNEHADTSPHEYDDSTANRVEKKPAGKQSPQQEHDDEDQG